MAADPKLEALLELERRGALPPDLAQRLQAYRSQGVSKTTALSPNGQPRQTDEERLELKTSRDKARSALALIGRVQPHLDRVKTLYDANLKGAGPVQSLREYLPSQRNAQFDAAVAPLRQMIRQANHKPGEGTMSDFESRLALQGVPDRWSFDGANEEALRNLQVFLDTSRDSYSKQLGLPKAPPRRPAPSSGGWTIREER
ncbi:hypothetical protein EWH08_11105 [Sphingobium indicum]|uniref:Uncharacterized protein n=2 Tax=Sphingobium indicum TaxID=332055 RepID=A0A1L5BSX6_SPHIB|nr:hypothetical protein [Sphingobium indicum]APL95976.1 hypothetical protein SIDU_16470 [Sphingobium indicum B90A]KEZ00068.1 hypothetical protein AI27_14635 [Sphingomonas sp. BHC-A]NYI23073.1 hypothetical protein [Sphingobium indicum]RYM01849.1 hypothetical protein EWH08_11105 [Sphingobium indicum]